jgi:hypothetical protein
MKKKTSIIVRDGALMDSIVLRSAVFSGCAAWKKPRLDISIHYGRRARTWRNKSIMCRKGNRVVTFRYLELRHTRFYHEVYVFDLVCVFKDLNAKGKGYFCNYEKFRSFCAKCV